MKKLFLILVTAMLTALPALSQSFVSTVLAGTDWEARKNVMQINVSSKMLLMASLKDKNATEETKKLFGDIDRISYMSMDAASADERKKLNKLLALYEELMSVTEDGQTVQMYTKENKKQIEELVMCIFSEKETVIMSITGKFSLQQLSALKNSINMKGSEHLNKLNDKTLKK